MAQPRRRAGDDKPDGGRSRLGQGSLSQQEDRPPGILGAAVQSPGRREIHMSVIAAQLEDDRREPVQSGGLLDSPENIGEFCSLRDKELVRADAIRTETQCVWKASLPEHFGGPDPQDRFRLVVHRAADQRQCETGRGAGVACHGAVYFCQGGKRNPAAHRRVEPLCTGGEQAFIRHNKTMPAKHSLLATRIFRSIQRLRQTSFNSGDVSTQGANGCLRRGVCSHGTCFRSIVHCLFL
jgi:hypothetical protein